MCMCVDVWWLYMVANLILLCSLKTYISFETYKQLCKRLWAILFISSSFSRWASKYPLFSICRTLVHFFISFFMNNFCIAPCFFLQQNFWEIATRTWSIYLMDIISRLFLVLTPSVGVKHFFLVDLDGMACFCAYPGVVVEHMWVVCTCSWF